MDNNTFDNSDIIISCPRCGEPMKSSQRCCIKCGALNPEHPDNVSMQQYIYNERNVTSGNNVFISQEVNNYEGDKKNRQKNICFIVNLILHLVLVFFVILYAQNTMEIKIAVITSLFTVGLTFMYNYAMQVIYMKAGKNWWSYWIPLYNYYIYYEITMENGWFCLLSFVPIVGFIVSIISSYQLGKRFGKSGWFTLLLAPIAIPVIAFSKKINYLHLKTTVDKRGRSDTEINYKRRSLFAKILLTIALVIIIYFSLPYLKTAIDNFLDFINGQK